MPNAKNVRAFADITERTARAKAILVAQYAGLNSKQQVKLRQELKKIGGELLITKNTLVDRVLKNDKMSPHLNGQSGIIFSYDDEVSALKALVAFTKEAESLKVKAGLIGQNVYEEKALIELSKLPGKMELLAQLLNRINAPATKLVGVLNAGARDLAFVLAEIAKKKQA